MRITRMTTCIGLDGMTPCEADASHGVHWYLLLPEGNGNTCAQSPADIVEQVHGAEIS